MLQFGGTLHAAQSCSGSYPAGPAVGRNIQTYIW